MIPRSLILALTLGALALGGCGNDPTAAPLVDLTLARLKSAGAAPTPAPVYTREQLAALGVPVVRIRIPSRGAEAVMAPRDQNAGTINFQTGDGSVYTTRDGVLIETRNMLPDLMSAMAPAAAVLRAGSGTHSRSYYFLGDEDATVRQDVTCTLSEVGPASLEILGRSHATRQVRETCTGEGLSFANDFWFEGAVIRQSSQWAGRQVGQVELAHIID